MTPTVEQLIDDEIRQLQQLKAMASKPRMLEFMRQIVGSPPVNGTAATQATGLTKTVLATSNGKVKAGNHSGNHNGVTSAVTECIKGFHGDFTIQNIVEKMKANGFHFTSKTPRIAVYTVTKKLLAAEQVEHVGKGDEASGSPYIYKYVGK